VTHRTEGVAFILWKSVKQIRAKLANAVCTPPT